MSVKKLTINHLLIDWYCPICGGETTGLNVTDVKHEHNGILYILQPNKAYREMNEANNGHNYQS